MTIDPMAIFASLAQQIGPVGALFAALYVWERVANSKKDERLSKTLQELSAAIAVVVDRGRQ